MATSTDIAGPTLRELVAVRDGRDSDLALVYNSWLQSYRNSPDVNGTPKRIYYGYHHPLITRILDRSTTQLLIAANPSDEDRVHGWICWELAGRIPVVHYIYVKQIWRRKGVARLLADEAGITPDSTIAYTFRAKSAQHLGKKVRAAEYVPVEDFI